MSTDLILSFAAIQPGKYFHRQGMQSMQWLEFNLLKQFLELQLFSYLKSENYVFSVDCFYKLNYCRNVFMSIVCDARLSARCIPKWRSCSPMHPEVEKLQPDASRSGEVAAQCISMWEEKQQPVLFVYLFICWIGVFSVSENIIQSGDRSLVAWVLDQPTSALVRVVRGD